MNRSLFSAHRHATPHLVPLALVCSVKCPGDLILKTYDLAQQLREAEVTIIGGFHSPMERECLTILLRGNQPLIVCPARSLKNMRLPAAYKKPLDQGRLLLLSSFSEKERRHTVELASRRNQFVAALSTAIFLAHAEPGSKTEALCHQVLQWGSRSTSTGQISIHIFSRWGLCLWILCLVSDFFEKHDSLIAETLMQMIRALTGGT